MEMDLLMPGALVSNNSERSANASVVSASLALAACPDEDDELALLDELLDDELVEDELLDDELLEDELLEDELLDDEPEAPPHPLSTTAMAASAKFKDFIFRSERSLLVWEDYPLAQNSITVCNSHPLHPANGDGEINHFLINSDSTLASL
jgi:hypothetical protein